MEQTVLVRHGQSARDLAQEPGLLLEIQFRGKTIQRKPFDPLHDNGRRVGFVQHGVDGNDGRVGQRRRAARLIEEAAADLGVGLRMQHFNGDRAVELLVMRGINDAEGALAQPAFQAVPRQPGGRDGLTGSAGRKPPACSCAWRSDRTSRRSTESFPHCRITKSSRAAPAGSSKARANKDSTMSAVFSITSEGRTQDNANGRQKKRGSSTLLAGENAVFVQKEEDQCCNFGARESFSPAFGSAQFTGNKAAASRRTPKRHGFHRGETTVVRAAWDP